MYNNQNSRKLIRYTGFVLLFFLLILSFSNCKSTKNNNQITSAKPNQKELDTITIENDSIGYKIQILEVGFWSWLQTQRPRGYYNQYYLENRNWRYVTAYNIRVNNFTRYDPNLYARRINYNTNIDYGYEVNYLLYYYFKFFEQKYNVNLLR